VQVYLWRLAGVPARIVSVVPAPPGAVQSAFGVGLQVEAYTPPYGWVPVSTPRAFRGVTEWVVVGVRPPGEELRTWGPKAGLPIAMAPGNKMAAQPPMVGSPEGVWYVVAPEGLELSSTDLAQVAQPALRWWEAALARVVGGGQEQEAEMLRKVLHAESLEELKGVLEADG